MARFEPLCGAPIPQSLDLHAGDLTQVRCLSNRANREVYLTEDATGARRVFKIHRKLTTRDLLRLKRTRKLLQLSPHCPYLLPLLAFGTDLENRTGWEELPLADGHDNKEHDFQTYTPVRLEIQASHGSPEALGEVATIALGILEALSHLNRHGLIHGDVKPSNLLRFQGHWVLGDYDTLTDEGEDQVLSASTEGYQPPGERNAKDRDTYALGKSLYELWTGNTRLEYPTLPKAMLSQKAWSMRERVINDLIHALCSPVGVNRLTRLDRITEVLQALKQGETEGLRRAASLLQPGRNRRTWLAPLGTLGLALSYGIWTVISHLQQYPVQETAIDGIPLVVAMYRHPTGVNKGTVVNSSNGLLSFNIHGTVQRPLKVGDQVEFLVKKDTWRGHVAAYLTDTPRVNRRSETFGHRGNFGGLDHLMFFHLDGDSLVAPTQVRDGTLETLDREHWVTRFQTNSLAPYSVELDVKADRLNWRVSCDGKPMAEGWSPHPSKPIYLNLYVFDNTTAFWQRLSISNGKESRPEGDHR